MYLLLALVSLYLVVNPVFDIIPIGLLMALGAAMSNTLYILTSTRVLKGLDEEVATFYIMAAASLSFLMYDSFTSRIHLGWNLEAWVWIILFFCNRHFPCVNNILSGSETDRAVKSLDSQSYVTDHISDYSVGPVQRIP